MKTPLLYGSLIAIAGALITFGLFFAGYHDSVEKFQVAQRIGTWAGLAIAIVCLALAMRERRTEYPADRDWGYGPALGTGVLTGLIGAVLGSIIMYIYSAHVNPQYTETMIQAQVAAMEQKGVPSSQIDAAQGMMRKFNAPGVASAFQIVFGTIILSIISLIVAIFFRKRQVAVPPIEAQPPVA